MNIPALAVAACRRMRICRRRVLVSGSSMHVRWHCVTACGGGMRVASGGMTASRRCGVAGGGKDRPEGGQQHCCQHQRYRHDPTDPAGLARSQRFLVSGDEHLKEGAEFECEAHGGLARLRRFGLEIVIREGLLGLRVVGIFGLVDGFCHTPGPL